MSISTFIRGVGSEGDGSQQGIGARVTEHGSLIVSVLPAKRSDVIHAMHGGINQRYYSSAFKTTAGSSVMNVNGAVTPVSFRVSAETSKYRVIQRVIIYMEDTLLDTNNAEVRGFGSVAGSPGLTNGILHQVSYSGIPYSFGFPVPIQSLSDFVIHGDIKNILNGVSASVDILSVKIDLLVPIQLAPETKDYIEILVRDNLTAINVMYAYAIGYEEDA